MTERSTPKFPDSIQKMLHRLSRVSKEPITQGGKQINAPPKAIFVSPALLRRFDCVSGCIACCCVRITVDFTPKEFKTFRWRPEIHDLAEEVFQKRTVEVNGKEFKIVTYDQWKDNQCQFLKPVRDGNLGCSFYGGNETQPLECASAPQLAMSPHGEGETIITKRPFGRAWAFKVKPQCKFEPIFTHASQIPPGTGKLLLKNEIMLLRRYDYWAEYFGIPTWIPEIIEAMIWMPTALRHTPTMEVVQVRCSSTFF